MKRTFWWAIAVAGTLVACKATENEKVDEKVDEKISTENTVRELEKMTGLKWKPVDLDTMKVKPGYIPYDSLVKWAKNPR